MHKDYRHLNFIDLKMEKLKNLNKKQQCDLAANKCVKVNNVILNENYSQLAMSYGSEWLTGDKKFRLKNVNSSKAKCIVKRRIVQQWEQRSENKEKLTIRFQ